MKMLASGPVALETGKKSGLEEEVWGRGIYFEKLGGGGASGRMGIGRAGE